MEDEFDQFQRPDWREEVVAGLWSEHGRQAIFCALIAGRK